MGTFFFLSLCSLVQKALTTGAPPDCSFLPDIANAHIQYSTINHFPVPPGGYATVTCNFGSTHWPDRLESCVVNMVLGITSGLPVKGLVGFGIRLSTNDVVACRPLPDIANAHIQYSPNNNFPVPPGGYAIVTCNFGYTLVGSAGITCLKYGGWEDPWPSCQRSRRGWKTDRGAIWETMQRGCRPLPNIANAQVQYSTIDDFLVPPGGYAKVSCNLGYTLVGSARIICNEYSAWDDAPSCGRRPILILSPELATRLGDLEKNDCSDGFRCCPSYAQMGYCNRQYMSQNCKASCHLCRPNYLPGIGCHDYFTLCKFFSTMSQCEKNEYWMGANCRNSCNWCGVARDVDGCPYEKRPKF